MKINKIIETEIIHQFEKSKMSLGLVWPAVQARPRSQPVHSALNPTLSQTRPGQA
jgi:hypothetical protein